MEREQRERERERERELEPQEHRPPSPLPMTPLEPSRISPAESASTRGATRLESVSPTSTAADDRLPSANQAGASYPVADRYRYGEPHDGAREDYRNVPPPDAVPWGQWPVQNVATPPGPVRSDSYRYPPVDSYEAEQRRRQYAQYEDIRSPPEAAVQPSPPMYSSHPGPSGLAYSLPQQIVLGPGGGARSNVYFPHPGGPGNGGPPPGSRAKPKRLKAHTVTSRSYSIPMVPRDKKGGPSLPLNVGIMTVHHLGEICMREHFHTERYIFPVNYEVTRYVRNIIRRVAGSLTLHVVDVISRPSIPVPTWYTAARFWMAATGQSL